MKERLYDILLPWGTGSKLGDESPQDRHETEHVIGEVLAAIKADTCKCGHGRSWHIHEEQPEECGFHWRDEDACIIDCRCEKYIT